MSKIDINRFICDLFSTKFNEDEKEKIRWKCESRSVYAPLHVALMAVCKALKQQGLVYKDGEIVDIEQPPLTEEQKPKFKVGDWITSNDKNVHNDYRICKISKIENNRYYIGNGDYLNKDTIEQYDYHLWTIQDAKPGDVLYNECCKNIILFTGKVYENDEPGAYCGFDLRDRELEVFFEDAPFCSRDVYPATKVQSDLLFKEIEEAGYRWNQEELRLELIDKPQTIRFNKPGEIDSVWPKEIVDELLEETQKNTPKVKDGLKKFFSNVFHTIYDIDIEKMVEDYKEEEAKVLLPLGFSKEAINDFSLAYRNGIEDMLKLIKGGGEYEHK